MKILLRTGFGGLSGVPSDIEKILNQHDFRSHEAAVAIESYYLENCDFIAENRREMMVYYEDNSDNIIGKVIVCKTDKGLIIKDLRMMKRMYDGNVVEFCIYEIPEGKMWCLDEYDGSECIRS